MSFLEFHNPNYLFCLFLIPVYFSILFRLYNRNLPHYNFFNIAVIKQIPQSIKLKFRKTILLIIKTLTLSIILLCFSEPYIINYTEKQSVKALDIMIALDFSESMAAEDFKPNRLENAKKIIKEYILNRNTDRVGIVIFGRGAYLKSPLTFDHNNLSLLIDDVKIDYIPMQEGEDIVYNPADIHTKTYIASAIGLSSYYLQKSESKNKIIILLTDGIQTGDDNDPIEVSIAAAKKNIRIYAIGIGSANQRAPFPKFYQNRGKIYIKDSYGYDPEIKVDEKFLSKIAQITGGNFYTSSDKYSLKNIFEKIDKIEKNEVNSEKKITKKSLLKYLIIIAVILLFLELIVKNLFFVILKDM